MTAGECEQHNQATIYDVAIIGGGVQGACIFERLSRLGYRVLLVDKDDFGSGTSQASAMLVWGGLLYLKNLDVAEVWRLSALRDQMIQRRVGGAHPHGLAYVFGQRPNQSCWFIHAGLWVYWLLGRGRRRSPIRERDLRERLFLQPEKAIDALIFEEGQLPISDARFVFEWIAQGRNCGGLARNYCRVGNGNFDSSERLWRLELRDGISGEDSTAKAKCVPNPRRCLRPASGAAS